MPLGLSLNEPSDGEQIKNFQRLHRPNRARPNRNFHRTLVRLTTPRSSDIELAVKSRLPASYPTAEFIEAGGLMTYSPNINDLSRRAATFVDKILKGTKPADLPVEQPIKFEFIINLKAAKQIGLTIPPNVLVRADRVIK